MKIITIELVAAEPLVITDGSAEGMAHACLDYIPGGKLLGSFADIWIREHPRVNPDESAEFQSLFLDGQVSWGHAYPLCDSRVCAPVPASYMREKNFGGLPLAGERAPASEFALFNRLPLKDGESLEDIWKKRAGGEGPRPKFKKLSAAFMQPETMRQPVIPKVWNTRVALNDQRVAQESQLFGFSAIAPGAAFSAEIFCETEAACQLLLKMIAKNDSIRIGHARSAGYGKTGLRLKHCKENGIDSADLESFDLFLMSDYLPLPSWENPLENLMRALEEKFSLKPTLISHYTDYRRLEAYNGHWHAWRDSRAALKAGSALRISFDEKRPIPKNFRLGADQLEGYGRVLVNPPFLLPKELRIEESPSPPAEKPPAPPVKNKNNPVWLILKERALDRQARRQALAWLNSRSWREFLKSARRLDHPTASQRANLLTMELEDFKLALAKSAAAQWTQKSCFNPFGDGREYLSQIILNLLDHEKFSRRFPVSEQLPWQDGEDEKEFARRAHELFRRELIRAWGKDARICRQSEEEGG